MSPAHLSAEAQPQGERDSFSIIGRGKRAGKEMAVRWRDMNLSSLKSYPTIVTLRGLQKRGAQKRAKTQERACNPARIRETQTLG